MLFIEHDMNVVFRFAQPHHRHGGRADPGGGHARGDRRRCARARGLSRRSASWLRRCLRSRACAPVTATPSCSTASRSRSPSGGSLALLGRNGVGKTTLLLTIMGFTRVSRGTIAWRGRDITRLAPHRRARDGHRLGGAGARDIPLPQRGGKPHGGRAAGTLGRWSRSTTCSRGSRSGAPAPAITSRAASSRCWRSRAR